MSVLFLVTGSLCGAMRLHIHTTNNQQPCRSDEGACLISRPIAIGVARFHTGFEAEDMVAAEGAVVATAAAFEEQQRAAPARSRRGGGEVRVTLFTKLGGVKAVKAVVAEMYTRLLADEVTAPFFAITNMAHLKQHQVEFMKIAFTQIPEDLDVPSLLEEKHMRLFLKMGLNETHFDKVADHFVGACNHLGVEQDLIAEAVEVIGPLRSVFRIAAIEHGKGKLRLAVE